MKQINLRIFISILGVLFSSFLTAQTPTFEDIGPIIWDNCATCHHDGGLANTTFLSYQEIQSYAYNIKFRINSTNAFTQMPPWPPNPNYQQFAHQRTLNAQEIQLISDWADNGTPAGDTANLPPPPSFGTNSVLTESPDLQLRIPNYSSKASAGNDDYVCFVLNTGLNTTKRIKAIEVIPGNREIVHHVIVYKDSLNFQTDTLGGDCGGVPDADIIAAYVPGSSPVIYPNNSTVKMGVSLYPRENIVLNLHYPLGSFGQWDSTKVNFYFYDDSVANVREVSTNPILGSDAFCFNPNSLDSLDDRYPAVGGLAQDYSILAVNPHAHLLCQNFIVYAVTPLNDTIPIIEIPQWNFEWQDFYVFKNPLKIPQGSFVYTKAVYDNTTNNTNNPNSPPQLVCQGDNTSDEMFLVYFQYVPYQTGDELIDLEALTSLNTAIPVIEPYEAFKMTVAPNPFDQSTTIRYTLNEPDFVALNIYDVQGRLLRTLVAAQQQSGQYQVEWNALSKGDSPTEKSLFFAHLRIGNQSITKKIIQH